MFEKISEYNKKHRVEQKYTQKTEDENFAVDILTNLIQRLEEKKAYYDLKSTKSKSDMMRDKFLDLLKNNKIKFNGKIEGFRPTKDGQKTDGISFQSCIQTVDSLKPRFSERTVEEEWWDSTIRPIFQEEIVREQARRQGLLVSSDEVSEWQIRSITGTEAVVYEDPQDKTKVLKIVKFFQQEEPTFTEFCERNIGFNIMFPATKYDLIRFAEKSNGSVQPILRQNYVYGDELKNLSSKEYDKFLEQYRNDGYEIESISPGYAVIRYGGYEASDLHNSNILKGKDETYYVIDAFVEKITR